MNLLPFVVLIIMVLALFSLSQFQGSVVQKKEGQIYLAYFRGLRKARNEKVKNAYEETLPKKAPPRPSSGTRENFRSEQKVYFREKKIGWDRGRLNLSFLLKKPCLYPALEKVAIDYINSLYSHTSFFPRDQSAASRLLIELIAQYREVDSATPLYKIQLSDPTLQTLFYKMVKGTHTYDLGGKGSPPLGEVLTFEKTDASPINFHYATIPFLSAVLGAQTALALVQLEREKIAQGAPSHCSPLSPSKLKAFLQKGGVERERVALFQLEYLPSSHAPATYRDPTTEISVKVR